MDVTHQLRVETYSAANKAPWDEFVDGARNATFLFRRDYMDYHSSRFEDHSLMVWRDDELLALLPANLALPHELASHQGLTYGGLLVRRDAGLEDVLLALHGALRHLDATGIDRLLYKRMPRFYDSVPGDEIDYGLFLLDARLTRRD